MGKRRMKMVMNYICDLFNYWHQRHNNGRGGAEFRGLNAPKYSVFEKNLIKKKNMI